MFGGLSWATGPSAASATTATTTFNASIVLGSDDSEEAATSGSIVSGSDDLELSYDGGAANDAMLTGLRFQNVTIPQGANILSAYIQFTVKDAASSVGNPTIDIHGQNADSPGTFTTTASDISSRPLTTATVAWNPPSWNNDGEAGAAQRTPDLASIVQEIVDRDGWAGGNAMAFVLSSQNSDANNRRIAAAFEHNTFAAPSLEIVFEGEHAGGGDGIRTILLPDPSDWTDHGAAVVATGNVGDWNYRYRGGDFSQPVEKDGTLYCYIIGADGERSGDGGPRFRRLGLMTSTDGENWSVHPDSPLVEFFPQGDGGSNNEEEGVLTAACAIDDAGDFHLCWSGMTANAPTQVLVEHFYSVASDGVGFSNSTTPTANRIIASDDASFAGQVSNPNAAEDESWCVDVHWNEVDDRFEYYYTVKSDPVRAQYHVAGADLNNLDGAHSALVIDKPGNSRWWMGHLVDRGNDNFDYFVSGADDLEGQLRRIPMNGRDFTDFGSHELFYDFAAEDGIAGFVKTMVYPSRALNKWIMLYQADSSEIRIKTAPLAFEPELQPLQTILLPAEEDWIDHGDVILEGTGWEAQMIGPRAFTEKDGTLFAYYYAAEGPRSDPDNEGPAHRKLGVATSTDGINWTKHPGNPIISFSPEGDGGSNNEEEGILAAAAVTHPDGTIYLAWGGMEAVSPTQVKIEHYLSTSTDGVNFTNNDAASANLIMASDDGSFAGQVSNPDAAEDESWPTAIFWNAELSRFEYYYMVKSDPQRRIYHVHATDLDALDGANSRVAVDISDRSEASIVDRGNDNIDMFADVSGQAVINRHAILARDFSNPESPVTFYDDFAGTGSISFTIHASRTLGKWIMVYRDNNVSEHIRVKTAPLKFEGGDDGSAGNGDGEIPASAQWFYDGSALTDAEIDDYNALAQTKFDTMEADGFDELRHQMSPDQDFRIRAPGTYYPPFILTSDLNADILKGDVHCQKLDSHTDRHTMWEVIQNPDETTFDSFATYNGMEEHVLYRFGYQFYIPSSLTTTGGCMVAQCVAGDAGGPWMAQVVDPVDPELRFRWRFLGNSDGQPDAGGGWETRNEGIEDITLDEWHTVEVEFIIDSQGTTDGYGKLTLDGVIRFDSSVDPGGPIMVGPDVPTHPSPFLGLYHTNAPSSFTDPVDVYMRNLWFEEV